MADPGPSSSQHARKPANAKSSASRQEKTDSEQKHTKAFDFTQRKRWADILVNELSGAVVLVLSSAATIVFVGEAARELLNWSDTNVQGMKFNALMHPDDVDPFTDAFLKCVREHSELAIFVRLKSYHTEPAVNHTGGKWPLYEIRGHPHYGPPNLSAPFAMGSGYPQAECKAFFATARPYPTRGSAILDSFLELKVENERLHRSLEGLHLAHPDLVTAAKEEAAAAASAPTRRRAEKEPRSADDIAVDSNGVPLHPFAYDFAFPPAQGGALSGGGVQSIPATGEDVNAMRRHSVSGMSGEETSSRKRGKGPLGPKTLCNACGLRFSKKVKTKASDPSSNGKDEPSKPDNGVDGEDGLGDEDSPEAGDLGTDNAGIIDGGGISQSPIMHTHHELDFSGGRVGYDIHGMHPPPAPNKLAPSHSLAARHSMSGGLPQQSLPPPFNNQPGASEFIPVSMTVSMSNQLSSWFAGGGRSPVMAYNHPAYSSVGEPDNQIRAPQPKQALQPLQTHFSYNNVMGGGPSSTLSSSGHSVAPSGPMYHHYQPPGGQN
ncbi:blue light receptor [Tulasnella sp. 417]|nr:blue light receptor [Tulasnella sp. 417]